MEYAYSILMFCFSGAILLYAGLIAPGNDELIGRSWAAKMKDKKAYARQFAKLLALISLAPLLSGVVALICSPDKMPLLPVVVLIGGTIVCIRIGLRFMRDVM